MKYNIRILILTALSLFLSLTIISAPADNPSLNNPSNLMNNGVIGKNIILDDSADNNILAPEFQQQELPKQNGYIVKLEEKPIAVEEAELKEKAEKNEKYIKENPVLSTIIGFRVFATRENDVPKKVEKHKNKVKSQQETAKRKIRNELVKLGKITGNAVADDIEEITLSEYKTVFNGFALDISAEEAEEIKEIKEVEEVYPNLEVKTTLMDSVPLINADDVWQLDASGNNCIQSGNECLTGKGVSIAIIDTGVDYTHSDLGDGCFVPEETTQLPLSGSPESESKYTNNAESSTLPKTQLEMLMADSQQKYEIQLDIPSYLDQRLAKPKKFFSGRKLKIIRKDGSGFLDIPHTSTLSKRDTSTKEIISTLGIENTQKGKGTFSLSIPKDAETGFYTIEFNAGSEKIVLPIQIYGLTTAEKTQISSTPSIQQADSAVSFIRRLECGYCFWESVSIINPTDENFGYFVGGGAYDYIVQTTNGWQTSTVNSINSLTSPLIREFRGDPKVEFSADNKLLVASLLQYPEDVITGGIYTENSPKSIPPRFTQTYVQSIPPNLPPEDWIIFDYEKIAVDKNPTSQFFGTTYMSVNFLKLNAEDNYGAGLITVKPNGQIIEKKTSAIGLPHRSESLLVGKNGIIYAGTDPGGSSTNKLIYRSLDGGETFSGIELSNSKYAENIWCRPKVSSSSERYWGIYDGPELAQDNRTGRLYAAWSRAKGCRVDPSSEFGNSAYDNDVFISYSGDNGATWSNPIRVNDDFTGGDQGFPDIQVDENGIVYVVFLDHRDNQNLAQFDVYLAFSRDNGQTFSKNIKLNDVSVNNVYGGRDPGDYLDMLSVGQNKIYVTYPCTNLNFFSYGPPNDACVSVLNRPLAFQSQLPSQCADGIDNDRDGLIDYPADSGCESTYDNDETTPPQPESCKVIGGYDFVNNDNDPMDDNGHGTHVAATAAGNGILKGVAPDANIYAYKVLNSEGSGSWSNIMAAIERAVDPNQDGDTSDHLDIISMSLGGWGDPDDPISQAVDNAADSKVVSVIAAGNSGPSQYSIASPGTARKAITVGATYKRDYEGGYWYDINPRVNQITSFSSRGPVAWYSVNNNIKYLIKPDIAAPGAVICAAQSSQDSIWQRYISRGKDVHCLDEAHIEISGTSMATPHISGVVALLKQKYPSWTPEEIKMALRNTAKKLTDPNTLTQYSITDQGYGMVDIIRALQLESAPPIAEISNIEENLGKIGIIGTAKWNGEGSYTLYYGEGEELENWNEIETKTTQVENDFLIENLDISFMAEGINRIRLVVSDANQNSEDNNFIYVNNVEIISPNSGDISRLGDEIDIIGTIKYNSYSYSIYYAKQEDALNNIWHTEAISLTGVDSPVENANLGTLDTSILTEGFYNIKITINTASGERTEYIEDIFFDSSIKQGWPQKIETYVGFRDFSAEEELLLLDKNNNLIKKLPFQNKNSFNKLIIDDVNESRELHFIGNKLLNSVEDGYKLDVSAKRLVSYWPGFLEPVVSDVNKDGKKEVFVYRAGNPTRLYGFNEDGSILNGFPVDVPESDWPGGNIESPTIADIDKDGFKEIIVNGGYWLDQGLYIYNHDGTFKDKISLNLVSQPNTVTVIFDVDRDGNVEIIRKYDGFDDYFETGEYYGEKLAVFDNKGDILSGWPNLVYDTRFEGRAYTCSGFGAAEPSPAVGDIDGDEEMEIIVAATRNIFDEGHNPENPWDTWHCEGRVYAFNLDGSSVDGFPVDIDGKTVFSPVTTGDIDKSGGAEIAIGTFESKNPNFGLYLIDGKGNFFNGWPKTGEETIGVGPSFIKLQNDDVGIVSKYGYWGVYIFDKFGNALPNWPIYTGLSRSPIIIDINNNGIQDILLLAYRGYIEGRNINSNLILSKYSKWGSVAPSVYDLDNNGNLELISSNVGDLISNVFVWELNVPPTESEKNWPMFQHDPQHTGCYDCSIDKIPSKVRNFDKGEISGSLIIKLQKSSSGSWIDSRSVYNQQVTIPAGESLDIAEIFNSQNIAISEAGNYRVYASLTDANGNILKNREQEPIEASYEFTVI